MHGAGNDFVLLDLRTGGDVPGAERVRALADRHTGIGFDQLLSLHADARDGALARFEVRNADGSRAGQCGNGARCLGLYLDLQGDAPAGVFTLEGPSGPVELECLPGDKVRVNMGVPRFDPAQVPTTLDPGSDGRYALDIEGATVHFHVASMGNPHVVLEVDDVSSAPVHALGPALQGHAGFPDGCNVGFAQVVNRGEIRLRVYERGAGETLACGSGACAAVAVLARTGALGGRVDVQLAGGKLMIEWKGEETPAWMTGPATYVFTGEVT